MINEYTVKYYLGTRKNIIYQLFVSAHDKEEAGRVVVAQARRRHKCSSKVNVVDITGDVELPVVSTPEVRPLTVIEVAHKYKDGCINMSMFALCAYITLTAIACAVPCWLTYILIKWIGG